MPAVKGVCHSCPSCPLRRTAIAQPPKARTFSLNSSGRFRRQCYLNRSYNFSSARNAGIHESVAVNYELIRQDEFERAAMPHTGRLLRAAMRITQERAAAEDLVQETLLRAWRAFDQFERGTNCKAWLFRIMLNVSSKSQRSAQAKPSPLPLDGREPAGVIPLRPPQLTAAEVSSALDSLSAEHRLVLILAVVEGFTCKEIAGICCLPIGTVMSRLSRGRAELRQLLLHSQREERPTANAANSA